MGPRVRLLVVLAGALLLCPAGRADAFETDKYRYVTEGKIRAVRAADLDGDGRKDLVVLTEPAEGSAGAEKLVILRAPGAPARGTFFRAMSRHVLALDGALAKVGALAIGRFGPNGETRIRLLDPAGITEVDANAKLLPTTKRLTQPCLFRRGPGRGIAVWDGVADLDGDGKDELWFPAGSGNGNIVLLGGTPEGDRRLSIETKNYGSSSEEQLLVRNAYVPRLVPTDLDGDGKQELTALVENELVVWPAAGGKPGENAVLTPARRIRLSFLDPDPNLPAEATRAPRIQLTDVDGDKRTDLLVTLVTGRRDKLGSLRTTLFHYPGPFVDAETGKLVKPRVRIDTESVALHPTFVDLDGDGDKDYVGDSIRGTLADLMAQMMGRDPVVTYVGFRFDKTRGTYEETPYFTLKRSYALSQAMSNVFARSAWFDADFDGDGLNDLLDVGNLSGVELLRAVPKKGSGPGDPLGFGEALMPKVAVKDGLACDGLICDLTGDGVKDIVLRGTSALYVVISRRAE